MSRFKTSLTYFLAGLPLMWGKAQAAPVDKVPEPPEPLDPVKLRPLNLPGENLFAAHRSHASHGSHRSSSGGSYTPSPTPSPSPAQRAVPAPAPARPQPAIPVPGTALDGSSGRNQPVDPGRAAPVSPNASPPTGPNLTLTEKKRLQILRVQIALTSVGLYSGRLDGNLNADMKESLRLFQIVKGIEPNGLMSTDTLNALGVPAVQ